MIKKAFCIVLCVILAVLCSPFSVGEPELYVRYAMPEGRSENVLTDADVMTRVTVRAGSGLVLTLSGAGEGCAAYLEWFSIPQDARLEQFDADGVLLDTTVFQSPDAYAHRIPLNARCAKLILSSGKTDCTVSTLFVARDASDAGREWMEPTAACDMLFLAPTPADAMESFGPVLAQYGIAHGVSVGVVCMTVDHRYCAQELEHALYAMGFRNAPVYLGCSDLNYLTDSEVHKRWERNDPVNKLISLISALQP